MVPYPLLDKEPILEEGVLGCVACGVAGFTFKGRWRSIVSSNRSIKLVLLPFLCEECNQAGLVILREWLSHFPVGWKRGRARGIREAR